MSDCNKNSCNTSKESCSKESSSCPTKSSCECPIESSIEHWNANFECALNAASVEILKAKIIKAWGPMMEKSADAIMQAMEQSWSTSMAQAKAHVDLRQQFMKIYSEGKK